MRRTPNKEKPFQGLTDGNGMYHIAAVRPDELADLVQDEDLSRYIL